MIRIPLVIKLPNQRYAGTRIASVTQSIDVMPTILDVIETMPPAWERQGSSLRPLWATSPARSLPPALSESLSEAHEKKSLRTERHRFIVSTTREQVDTLGRHYVPEDPEAVELYDLALDPEERQNLTDSATPANAALVERLHRTLRQLVAGRRGRAEQTRLDEETVEALRDLGYIE